MSVKIYDREQKKWIIFPGTIGAPGKDAYLIAQENGYTGTKEEYTKVLTDIPELINSIEKKPTEGSENLVTSGGVWQAIEDVYTTIDDQIKSSIIDNLESLAADKSLSANQGRILKEMIANLANLRIEVVDQLPGTGETNVIYLVKKVGSEPDVHDEYVFVNGKWEKIGSTDVDLSNYYTKEEVDEKIASAGGGDVIASGNLVNDNIIIGAGTKSIKNSGQTLSNLALKSEIPSLSGYATESWVTNQGYSTENTWRPVKVGSTTLSDSSTTLTIANGTGIGLTFANGTLTITNSATGSSYTLPVAKDNVLGGIKTGYTESGGAEMAIYTLEDGTAYTFLRDTTVKTALGYTPANVDDIPEIPIALPNPYSLNITANGTQSSYTGSSAVSINLDNFFSKKLPILTNPDDAGKPGIFFTTDGTTQVNITARVTKDQPDAVVVVPGTTPVVIDESTTFNMQGIDSLIGSVDASYKCFCISWVAAAQSGLREDLILVNGALYG